MLAQKQQNQTSWKEFIAVNINGVLNQKLNFCIQDGRCQPQELLDIRNFLAEATLDTTDLDY